MSFIAKYITHHDERLVYIARLHWIYLVKGLVWFSILGGLGVYLNWQVFLHARELPSETLDFLPVPLALLSDFALGLIPLVTGFLIMLVYLFKLMGTEIALTNKRLIFKTGMFFVQSREVELSEISEVRIDNGWLGAVLGYGVLHLDCRFVGDFALPVVKNPYNLLRQINKLRAGHSDGATLDAIGLPQSVTPSIKPNLPQTPAA